MTVTDQYCVDFESSMNQLWFLIEYSIIIESSMIITTVNQCWSTLIISHCQKFYIRSTLIIIYNLWSRIDSIDSILIFQKTVKSILNRSSCFLGLDQLWSIVWSMHLSKWNRNTIDPHSIFIWSTQINIDSINYDRAKIEPKSSAYDRITFNNFSTNFLQCKHSINVVNIDIINIDETLIFDF